MKKLIVTTFCSLIAFGVATAAAQTFEIPGQTDKPSNAAANPRAQGKKAPSSSSESDSVSWGSSIELSRLSRAADEAMRRGNAAEAANYAERALRSAPNDPQLWFMLGYSSRLAGRYQTSIDAYHHGLQLKPGAADGLSGLAQTYIKLGRTDEAKKLLQQLIATEPRRADDLSMAGELFVQTGDLPRGVQYLERAEQIKPATHTEVLLAVAYLKSKQPERAKAILDRAKARGGNNADVLRAVADYYIEANDYPQALKALTQIRNKSADVLAEIGYVHELSGDARGAADSYIQAANASPKQLSYQLNAASALGNLGELDKEREYLARAQAISPDHYRLHQLRAELAKREKRSADAITEYKLAIANLPQQGVPEGALYPVLLHLNLSEVYHDVNDLAAANREIEIAEQKIAGLNIQGPARAEFLRVRASIRTDGGRFGEAEADLKEALQADPSSMATRIQYASLLWKMNRTAEAKGIYEDALKRDPKNRYALEALGYLAREQGDVPTAEKFFNRLKQAYPSDHVAYVALGDLYSALHKYDLANNEYEQAYKYAPGNAQIVAGGANTGIETHNWTLAGDWLARAKGAMLDDPRVMKQRERYLFFQGKYLESARVGAKVLNFMPDDRDAVVYLAYDLYNLGRYDDVLRLVRAKQDVLPKEPNLPLLAAHVEKQGQLLTQAVDDYTHAIEVDPKMLEAYVNRGYVLNDLQDPLQAAADFNYVLKSAPDSGTARLGLAFSYLQLKKGKQALDEVNAAEKLLGESGSTHDARATAYREMRLLPQAEKEYRAAIKFVPGDINLQLGLADTLHHERKYREAIATLNDALNLAPGDPLIFAQIGANYARLHDRPNTMKYIEAAEREASDESGILLNTGEALMLMGDMNGAMQRFERALEAPDSSRVDARMGIAKLMAKQGRWDDARQQISLAFAESRIGEAQAVTAENFIEAANLFLAMNDFDLAQLYFERAKQAGAADEPVQVGLANVYLAQGDSQRAAAIMDSLGSPDDHAGDYDYTITMANLYRQRRDNIHAMAMFGRATQLAGEEEEREARIGLRETAGEEGMRVTQKLSVGGAASFQPIFDDATIYIMDSRLFPAVNGTSAPPPRVLDETRWMSDFRYHPKNFPDITGFYELRNSRGLYSLPSEAVLINRNTYDNVFNVAINPVVHLGLNTVEFTTGISETIRRDRNDPVNMNQNLFRQFMYMSTSSFGNWVQLSGSAYHESGPFNLQNLHSRELGARLEFRVGHPWGRNAFITGYGVRDLLFRPLVREFFQTTTYAGWEHTFGQQRTLRVRGLAELVRGWRVQDLTWANGEIIRPAGEFTWKPNLRWSVNGSLAYSRGQGAHLYDNVESGFFISYERPLRRAMQDQYGTVPIEYPLRFSIGVQQQNFMNFTGRAQTLVRPVVRLTLF